MPAISARNGAAISAPAAGDGAARDEHHLAADSAVIGLFHRSSSPAGAVGVGRRRMRLRVCRRYTAIVAHVKHPFWRNSARSMRRKGDETRQIFSPGLSFAAPACHGGHGQPAAAAARPARGCRLVPRLRRHAGRARRHAGHDRGAGGLGADCSSGCAAGSTAGSPSSAAARSPTSSAICRCTASPFRARTGSSCGWPTAPGCP